MIRKIYFASEKERRRPNWVQQWRSSRGLLTILVWPAPLRYFFLHFAWHSPPTSQRGLQRSLCQVVQRSCRWNGNRWSFLCHVKPSWVTTLQKRNLISITMDREGTQGDAESLPWGSCRHRSCQSPGSHMWLAGFHLLCSISVTYNRGVTQYAEIPRPFPCQQGRVRWSWYPRTLQFLETTLNVSLYFIHTKPGKHRWT